MGNPSAVDAMRMVKERRTARISYKQDKQPDGRYLFYCPRHVHRLALLVWVSWLPHNTKIPVSIRLQSKNIHLDIQSLLLAICRSSIACDETPSLCKISFLLAKKQREDVVYTEYVITFAPLIYI